MAENQVRGRRTRNGARIGGGHSRTDAREMNSRFEFDERSSVGWRSLDRVAQFYTDPALEIPDWQPRD